MDKQSMSDTASTSSTKAGRYGAPRAKVAAFARFKGTSAWKKYRVRARAYDKFRAAERMAAQAPPAGR